MIVIIGREPRRRALGDAGRHVRIFVLQAGSVLFVLARGIFLRRGALSANVALVVPVRALLIYDVNDAEPRGHVLHFNVVHRHRARPHGHALESSARRREIIDGRGSGRFAAVVRAMTMVAMVTIPHELRRREFRDVE